MKPVHFIALLLVSVTFFACQKELQFNEGENPDTVTPPVTNGDIKGSWKFLYMDTDVLLSGEQQNVLGTVKITYSYNTATTNNAGIIKIDEKNCVGTAFAYTVNTNAVTQTSLGGIPQPEIPTPVNFSAPASNFSSSYKLIGTDSLYFEDGFDISMPSDPGSPLPNISNPVDGAKFQIKSDTLIMSTRTSLQQDVEEGGVSLLITQSAGATLYLKRQ